MTYPSGRPADPAILPVFRAGRNAARSAEYLEWRHDCKALVCVTDEGGQPSGCRSVVLVCWIVEHECRWLTSQDMQCRIQIRGSSDSESCIVEPERIGTPGEEIQLRIGRHREDRIARQGLPLDQIHQFGVLERIVSIDVESGDRGLQGGIGEAPL